jgi:putative redox protein
LADPGAGRKPAPARWLARRPLSPKFRVDPPHRSAMRPTPEGWNMRAIVRYTGGLSFLGRGETNHWVPMDGPPELKGENAGSRPKELLLIALGGCTGADVASILNKRRVAFRKLEVEVAADVTTEHPLVFTRFELVYRFEGDNIAVAEIDRAIRLSQDKYCSVSAMLRHCGPIDWSAEINGDRVLSGGEPVVGSPR